MAVAAVYESLYGDDHGVVATFQIIFLSGWAPHESQPTSKPRGSADVSLADLAKDLGTNVDAV